MSIWIYIYISSPIYIYYIYIYIYIIPLYIILYGQLPGKPMPIYTMVHREHNAQITIYGTAHICTLFDSYGLVRGIYGLASITSRILYQSIYIYHIYICMIYRLVLIPICRCIHALCIYIYIYIYDILYIY